MSFDKFKKLKQNSTWVPENPYTTTSKPEKKKKEPFVLPDIDTSDLGDFNVSNNDKDKILLQSSLINGQNKYLYQRLHIAEKTIEELKMHISSLYSMLLNSDDVSSVTKEQSRELYMDFLKDERNLINRIEN